MTEIDQIETKEDAEADAIKGGSEWMMVSFLSRTRSRGVCPVRGTFHWSGVRGVLHDGHHWWDEFRPRSDS